MSEFIEIVAVGDIPHDESPPSSGLLDVNNGLPMSLDWWNESSKARTRLKSATERLVPSETWKLWFTEGGSGRLGLRIKNAEVRGTRVYFGIHQGYPYFDSACIRFYSHSYREIEEFPVDSFGRDFIEQYTHVEWMLAQANNVSCNSDDSEIMAIRRDAELLALDSLIDFKQWHVDVLRAGILKTQLGDVDITCIPDEIVNVQLASEKAVVHWLDEFADLTALYRYRAAWVENWRKLFLKIEGKIDSIPVPVVESKSAPKEGENVMGKCDNGESIKGITVRSGSYVAYVTLPNGKAVHEVVGRVGLITPKQAAQKRLDIEKRIADGVYVPPLERSPAPDSWDGTIHPGKIYTQQEVAAFLRLNCNTLSYWRHRGNCSLAWKRFGNQVRYMGEDVLAFVKNGDQ